MGISNIQVLKGDEESSSNTTVETRNSQGTIRNFSSLSKAMAAAQKDPTIWKISFDGKTGERVRLVRPEGYSFWAYEPIVSSGDGNA